MFKTIVKFFHNRLQTLQLVTDKKNKPPLIYFNGLLKHVADNRRLPIYVLLIDNELFKISELTRQIGGL